MKELVTRDNKKKNMEGIMFDNLLEKDEIPKH